VVPDHQSNGHDIVVVGASAGGVEALSRLVRDLPADFPAAVFVVLHVPASGTSVLPTILDRTGPLPAAHAVEGEQIRAGSIYVAPPDRHVLIRSAAVRVERGPKENGARPAIDPLFRSAASAYGPRVVGVILSGTLRDGTIGLAAVKLQGGTTIVQDPEDALYPAMPRSAIGEVGPDAILPAAEIGAALVELTRGGFRSPDVQASRL
jgi:two-component system chemotaxis response regulator CheB